MAHNLTINEQGEAEMFSGQSITPWHKLGTIVSGLLTAKEAILAAKLNWNVSLQPVNVGSQIATDYKAIVRDDNQKVLSILGNRYFPIQNNEAFEFFDEIIGAGQAVYDTAGSLNGGKRVWIMAKLKGSLFIHTRPDDKIDKNVLLVTSHDGSSSLMMQIVSTRVVCQNTLSVALSDATNQIKIRHTRNYEGKKADAMKALNLCNGYFDNLQGVLNMLDAQSFSAKDVESFTERLVESKKDDEQDSTRTKNIRAEIADLFSSGIGNLGRTKWDMLNAVTEYCDKHRTTHGQDEASKEESRFSSSMFGSGATLKAKAFQLLTA
jgi:phage/plasmid-like protein (TIGR03299 family)